MTRPTFQHLNVATLVEWLDAAHSLTLVDIRDPASFAAGHLPDSRHLDNDGVPALLAEADRQSPLVVVCYHGNSSQQAAAWLAGQGFEDVYSLDGGFSDWHMQHPERVATGHDDGG